MENLTVFARTNVVGALPLQPNLEVVVLIQQAKEPVEELPALLLGHLVNVAHVDPDGEDALPPRHRVRPDDGVLGAEDRAHVLGGAPRLVVELEAVALRGGAEAGLLKGGCQALEELLVGLADEIVDLVTRGPEGI